MNKTFSNSIWNSVTSQKFYRRVSWKIIINVRLCQLTRQKHLKTTYIYTPKGEISLLHLICYYVSKLFRERALQLITFQNSFLTQVINFLYFFTISFVILHARLANCMQAKKFVKTQTYSQSYVKCVEERLFWLS